jgi:hypothetical protein
MGTWETYRCKSGRGSAPKPAPCGQSDALEGADEKTLRLRQCLHLRATRFAVQAPATEMFTIVLQQVVAPLSESRPGAPHDVCTRDPLVGGIPHVYPTTRGEICNRDLLHQSSRIADAARVVHHSSVTDIDTVMTVTAATHDELSAESDCCNPWYQVTRSGTSRVLLSDERRFHGRVLIDSSTCSVAPLRSVTGNLYEACRAIVMTAHERDRVVSHANLCRRMCHSVSFTKL